MEKTVEIAELRKKKLFIGTPMYGGSCAGMYTKSMCDLTALCTMYGIEMRSFFLFNESLITRARNYVVDEFLRSGFTHLMFIDSDIGFDPQDVIALLALTGDEYPDHDVLAGPYPKKCISWEKIKLAVDKGVGDDNPNNLEDFVGDFVFNPIITEENKGMIALNEPAEVLEAGTGFMMVPRKTFEKYNEGYPQNTYLPDHVRTENFDGSREIMMYFQAEIDPVSKRYLSEDYLFCQQIRAIGGKVFLCPWMQLKHVGSYIFGGNLASIASVGAAVTADTSVLKNNKPRT